MMSYAMMLYAWFGLKIQPAELDAGFLSRRLLQYFLLVIGDQLARCSLQDRCAAPSLISGTHRLTFYEVSVLIHPKPV